MRVEIANCTPEDMSSYCAALNRFVSLDVAAQSEFLRLSESPCFVPDSPLVCADDIRKAKRQAENIARTLGEALDIIEGPEADHA